MGVQAHCPRLEQLVLGWASEFKSARRDERGDRARSHSPDAAVGFNRYPCLAVAHVTSGLSCLRVLTLAGYLRLDDPCVRRLCERRPPLATLDLCGCRGLTDEGLSGALPLVARSLESLNVRGTGFGDLTAIALAAAGADILQLNASCTELTGRGLAAISEASSRLKTLDLCYATSMTTGEDPHLLLATVGKHGANLRMLGLGGFERMTGAMLQRILRMCTRLEHLGIGGCAGLGLCDDEEDPNAADSLLSALPILCPSLTALNAHRLPGVVSSSALAQLLDGLPALVALDVHGTRFDAPLTCQEEGEYGEPSMLSSPCGIGLEAFERWQHLGGRNPGEFFDTRYDGGRMSPFISPAQCVFAREEYMPELPKITMST